MTAVSRVLRGFAVLAGATLVTRLIGFAVLAVVARTVGPGLFGAYNFAVAIATYVVSVPSNFGLATLAIRDIARDRDSARRVTGEVLALQASLAALCLLALLALVPVLTDHPAVRTLLPIAGIYFVVYTLTADWALQAIQNMTAVALVRLAGQAVFAVTPLILVSGLEGAKRYAWMMVVGACVTAVLSLALVVRRIGPPQLPASGVMLARRLKSSVPIGFSLVMVQVYYTIDQVVLGYLKPIEEVGLYAAATKIPFVLIGFSTLWGTAFYPHASQLYERDPQGLRRQVGTFVGLGLAVSLPLGVGSSLVAQDLMVAVFGGHFAGAATAFALLVWATGILFVSVTVAYVLLAAGQERHFAFAVTAAAVLNVGLNFILIPPYGAAGAAAATVVAEAAVLTLMGHRFTRILGMVPLQPRRLASILASTGAMAISLILLPETLSVWVRLPIAAAVYAVAIAVLGVVRRSDLALLRRSA